MTFPDLTLILITYNRPKEIRLTLTAIAEKLHYSGRLSVLIADDSSPGNYGREVTAWAKKTLKLNAVLCQTPENGGWGRNANHAIEAVTTDFFMLCEDDYVLTAPIDLDPIMAALVCNPAIGLVRLDGVTGHRVVAHLFETNISALMPDYQMGIGGLGLFHYWQLDSGSLETWLYSNRPHICRTSFHAFYGKYPEGKKLGITEEMYAHMVKDGMKQPDAPTLIVPVDLAVPLWSHIGISYQHTDMDKGAK